MIFLIIITKQNKKKRNESNFLFLIKYSNVIFILIVL